MVGRKMRKQSDPYEIWYSKEVDWAWAVLGGYKKPENNGKDPYDRYFCAVHGQAHEMGDVYIREVVYNNHKVYADGQWLTGSMGLSDEKKAEIAGWFGLEVS